MCDELGIERRDLCEGIDRIIIGVFVEGGRYGGGGGVVGAVGAVGAEQDVGKGVGFPLQTQVAAPVVAAGEVRRVAVREGARRLAVEVLYGGLRLVVAVAVVPAEAEVDLQLIVVVVVQVGAEHLTGVKSAAVPPAGVLLLVVEIAEEHDAGLVGEAAAHHPRGIAVLGTCGQVEVGHIATVHAFLDAEVEHGLLLTVFDAGDARLI